MEDAIHESFNDEILHAVRQSNDISSFEPVRADSSQIQPNPNMIVPYAANQPQQAVQPPRYQSSYSKYYQEIPQAQSHNNSFVQQQSVDMQQYQQQQQSHMFEDLEYLNQFKVHDKDVSKGIAKMMDMIKNKEFECVSIDPDAVTQFTESFWTDYFTCTLCLFIVQQPVECSGCEKLFCKLCHDKLPIAEENHPLNDFFVYSKEVPQVKCPHCQQICATVKPRRIVLEQLDNLRFECKSCPGEAIMKYKQFKEHAETNCFGIKLPCLNQCDPTLKFNRSEMVEHLKHECPEMRKRCTLCDQFDPKYKFVRHDCIENFKLIKESLKDEIIQLKSQLSDPMNKL